MQISNGKAASREAAAGDSPTAEILGAQLRAALPPLRIQSLSLYDSQGDLLWLSEGALGPDEHELALDAIEELGKTADRTGNSRRLDDGRGAIFLAVRAPRGDLVGCAMVLADSKSANAEIVARVATPQVRSVLQRIAVLIRVKRGGSGATSTTTNAMPAAAAAQPLCAAPPTVAVRASGVVTPGAATPRVIAPVAVMPRAIPTALDVIADELLTLELVPDSAPAPVASSARVEATDPASDLLVYVQQLAKLRSGGRTRRFEVLARSRREPHANKVPAAFIAPSANGREGAVLDGIVVRRLLSWLGENRAVWETEPTSFSINLSIGSLEDENLPQLIAAALAESGVPGECIGFEVTEFACVQCKPQVERLIAACERLGCFIVLDNFTLDSGALPVLRSKALRFIKIDARLTTAALKDKVSQAMVVAIAQICKVLGMHCVAKRVESQTAMQWLSAVGCDLAQGFMLEKPLPLETLATMDITAEQAAPRRPRSAR